MGNEREQGEFNSALEYLRRINEFFAICSDARINLNSYSWASSLSCLFAELSTQMKDKEIETGRKELMLLLNEASFRKSKVNKIDASFYWKLYDFELFLRKIFRDSGLEMKVKADANRILFKGGT